MYLSNFYMFMTGTDGGTGKKFYMEIDWSKDAHRELFKLARVVRSRCMKGIKFCNFKKKQNKDILDYLTYNCPDQLRQFFFNADTYGVVYGSADYYLNGIAKVG